MSEDVGPDRWRVLYGAPDGRWLLIEGPVGQIGPPKVGDLMHLGDPTDLVILLYRHLQAKPVPVPAKPKRGNRAPRAQQEIAGILGVSQQTVSKYLDGTSELWRGPGNLAWSDFVKAVTRMRHEQD